MEHCLIGQLLAVFGIFFCSRGGGRLIMRLEVLARTCCDEVEGNGEEVGSYYLLELEVESMIDTISAVIK
jgi:hypothetical protein